MDLNISAHFPEGVNTFFGQRVSTERGIPSLRLLNRSRLRCWKDEANGNSTHRGTEANIRRSHTMNRQLQMSLQRCIVGYIKQHALSCHHLEQVGFLHKSPPPTPNPVISRQFPVNIPSISCRFPPMSRQCPRLQEMKGEICNFPSIPV